MHFFGPLIQYPLARQLNYLLRMCYWAYILLQLLVTNLAFPQVGITTLGYSSLQKFGLSNEILIWVINRRTNNGVTLDHEERERNNNKGLQLDSKTAVVELRAHARDTASRMPKVSAIRGEFGKIFFLITVRTVPFSSLHIIAIYHSIYTLKKCLHPIF